MLDTDEVPLVDTLLVADVVAVVDTLLVALVVPVEDADVVAEVDTLLVAVDDSDVVAELLTLLVAVLDKLVVALDVKLVVAELLTLVVALDVTVLVAVVCCSQLRKAPVRYFSMATFINDTVLLHVEPTLSAISTPPTLHAAVPDDAVNPFVWSARATIVLIAEAVAPQVEELPPNFSTSSPPIVAHPIASDGIPAAHIGTRTLSNAA